MGKKGSKQNGTTEVRRSSITNTDITIVNHNETDHSKFSVTCTPNEKEQTSQPWQELKKGVQSMDDMRKKVRQLPLDHVLPLLKELLDSFEKNPTARDTTEWLKVVLLTHTAYFMSQPDTVQRLSNVYKALDDRLTAYPKLLAMHGRLDLVHNQVEARRRRENTSDDEQALDTDDDEEEDEEDDQSESDIEDDLDDENEDLESDEDNLMEMDHADEVS
ncbi:hypothetical protein BD560DRAFT_224170 [Blakeslea trispora]|nr:hypothetical protein BD560DRAFT_224170 [Blakeslea trispora]